MQMKMYLLKKSLLLTSVVSMLQWICPRPRKLQQNSSGYHHAVSMRLHTLLKRSLHRAWYNMAKTTLSFCMQNHLIDCLMLFKCCCRPLLCFYLHMEKQKRGPCWSTNKLRFSWIFLLKALVEFLCVGQACSLYHTLSLSLSPTFLKSQPRQSLQLTVSLC